MHWSGVIATPNGERFGSNNRPPAKPFITVMSTSYSSQSLYKSALSLFIPLRPWSYLVIEKDVIQFKVIMERCQSKLNIVQADDSVIAKGAALMFVQKLFEIPSLEETKNYTRLTWDEVFEIQKKH